MFAHNFKAPGITPGAYLFNIQLWKAKTLIPQGYEFCIYRLAVQWHQ